MVGTWIRLDSLLERGKAFPRSASFLHARRAKNKKDLRDVFLKVGDWGVEKPHLEGAGSIYILSTPEPRPSLLSRTWPIKRTRRRCINPFSESIRKSP